MSRLENMKSSFKSVLEEINAFLHSQKWKEALIFLCFLLLAFGFWYLQSLQQEYEIEIAVPVKYKNVPPDITFTETLPEKISAQVKDKGTVLLNYSFGRKFVPIEINMKTISNTDSSFTITSKEIELDIQRQLVTTTSLIEFTPSRMDLKFSKRLQKDFPVSFDGIITPEPGFQLSGDIIIEPSYVTVYGGQQILDSLTSIKTTFTEIKKINTTTTQTVHLEKPATIAIAPQTVNITIPIEEFTEKVLEVPVICTDIPSEFTVRIFPAIVKVTCNIPLSRYKDLSADQFAISIPFTDLEQNTSGSISIQLSQKPDWIKSPTITPNKIEFILEQDRLYD